MELECDSGWADRTYQAEEPVQHHRGILADLQEGQKTEQQHVFHTMNRHTILRASPEDFGYFAFERKTEQVSTGAVYVAVPSRKGTPENHGINDVRQHLDA